MASLLFETPALYSGLIAVLAPGAIEADAPAAPAESRWADPRGDLTDLVPEILAVLGWKDRLALRGASWVWARALYLPLAAERATQWVEEHRLSDGVLRVFGGHVTIVARQLARGESYVDGLVARLDREYLLRDACGRGRLTMAAWLTETYELTAEVARKTDNQLLRVACKRGHLHMAKWIVQRFGLHAGDARALDNNALRAASARGHLEVVQWLAGRFHLTLADARACENGALRGACEAGHSCTAKWLVRHFGLKKEDALGAGEYGAFRVACSRGHLDIAQWLAGEFSLSRADVQASGVLFLRPRVGRADKTAVVDWLAKKYGGRDYSKHPGLWRAQ